MGLKFRDRMEAGQQLATRLTEYANNPNVLVLALPRGGVPVAYEIAQALNVPLDICLVRKLGVPGQPELAMGAVAADGVMVLNQDVLNNYRISERMLLQVAELEKQELARRAQVYRGNRPLPRIHDRVIILVDDGIATGATLRAAISLLRPQQPHSIIVAAPIASAAAHQALEQVVQSVVCLSTPELLSSIGMWYDNFSQTTDAEVCNLLALAAQRQTECSLG